MRPATSSIARIAPSTPIAASAPPAGHAAVATSPEADWRARLELELAPRLGRTAVVRNAHSGPLCVQKPFHPGDGSCHVYLLHPPGGLAGGDRLELEVSVRTGAHALVTTPAATKFYRSVDAQSLQSQMLVVDASAVLEWLPAETILFGGSRAQLSTRVALAAGARFVGWEIFALGRPLSGDRYATGALTQRFELAVDGKRVLAERLALDADDDILRAAWGLGGRSVWGTLYAYPSEPGALDAVRRICANSPGCFAAATIVDELLIVRALTDGVEALRALLEACWTSLREPTIGIAARPPRIWST